MNIDIKQSANEHLQQNKVQMSTTINQNEMKKAIKQSANEHQQ